MSWSLIKPSTKWIAALFEETLKNLGYVPVFVFVCLKSSSFKSLILKLFKYSSEDFWPLSAISSKVLQNLYNSAALLI